MTYQKAQYGKLPKDRLSGFIDQLIKQQPLAAPVNKGGDQYSFEFVSSADQVSLHHLPTILPPKKYFLPQNETLATYDTSLGQQMTPVLKNEKMTLFGVHTCDLAGIQSLNVVFDQEPKDPNYLNRKENITIIGFECNNYCDEYASCRLVHNHTPNGGYDLFMTELKDKYLIHINSPVGETILAATKLTEPLDESDLAELNQLQEEKRKIFSNEIPIAHEKISALFDKAYNSPVWKELGKRCLACGNCTNVCPTCYCFDVVDEPNLDLQTGQRCRRWDSCQNETFAKVAGGESFREARGARQRHRYFRKFSFPVNKYSRFFCTGCGRCSRACMANINLKETLTELIKEQR